MKSIDIAELSIPSDGVLVIWEWNWMAGEQTQESDTSRSPSEVATSIDFVNSVAYNGDIW